LRDPDVGRSLTIHPDPDRGLDPVGRVDLGLAGLVAVDLDQVVLAVTGLVDPGDRVDLRPADRVDLRPADRVDLDLGLVGLVGRELQDLTDRADLVAPVGRADLVGLVDLGLGRVDLDLGLVDRVDRELLVGLEDLVVPAVQDPTDLAVQGDRVDPVDPDLAGRVDRHRLGTHPGAHMIGVTRKWAAPLTRRTALAFPTMARRLRPGSTGSAGMADPLPEGLHITGTGRRLRVAGTGRRLPVVGTVHGMGRRAT
jgi:hypothetical protein